MKFFLLVLVAFCSAQEYDFLLIGGRVFDPRNGIEDRILDVAINDGVIAAVAPNLNPALARQSVNVSGLIVTPGLIDVHSHVFWGVSPPNPLDGLSMSDSPTAIQPDTFCPKSGVTTVVDGGGPGWRNFELFLEHVVPFATNTRVLAWINIVGAGMKGFSRPEAPQQNLTDMDPIATSEKMLEYPETIIGIKVAHYAFPNYAPLERGVEAGNLAGGLPVLLDWKNLPEPLEMEEVLLDIFRPGDVLTHVYGVSGTGGPALVDVETNIVKDYVWKAVDRGVLFDAADGGSGANLAFSQALPAIEQRFLTNTISTDNTMLPGGINGITQDLNNMMSKFLATGMTLTEVIERTTWNAAQMIRRPELGHLSVGAPADVAVLRTYFGNFGFTDGYNVRISGSTRIQAEMTLLEGRVVWDREGLVLRDNPAEKSMKPNLW